jgi:cobalt-zinc-cadmium efflux system outer membrane protein
MKISVKALLLIIILLPAPQLLRAQQEITFAYNPVSFTEYLSAVVQGNIGYIAEKFSVSIAEAELKAARIFPDPEISLTYVNNEDARLQMGQAFESEISYPVSLGNRRKAGISLAKSRHELSQMMLDLYFQNLRADAAMAYYACLRDQKKYEIHLSIYEQLVKLASADSIRLNAGDATGLDAMQSSLEAMAYLTEVMQSLAEMQNSGMDLMQLQGKKFSSSLDMASGDFPDPVFHFSIDGLLEKAFENRAELLIAVKSQEVSEKNLGLLRANRAFEFNLEAGYSYNSIVLNEIAPAPAFNAVTAGLSFPIKFSGMNRGEIRAAEAEIRQNQDLRNETELQIYTEMMQAYNNFITQAKKAEQFSKGLAETAGRILQGRIYAYQRGETGLVDVLNAQRTFMDLQLSQLDTWFDYTAALIEVERAAGIWDLPE